MTNKAEKTLSKNERINGTESSNVIMYSDDYDGLDNSEFNTKVCMLTFWTGYLYFPGGEVTDKSLTLEDNIINYVKRLLDFDISHYKKDLVHISSKYIADDHAVHTYALKIKKMEMASLQIKNISFDENGDPDEQSQILLDTCGINKFNVSRNTLDFVMKNNFGPGVKTDFERFINLYVNKKIKNEQDFIAQLKNKMEMDSIARTVSNNTQEIQSELYIALKAKGMEFLLDKSDERSKILMDSDGNYKDEELAKLFDKDVLAELFGGDKEADHAASVKTSAVSSATKSSFKMDFTQKAW